MQCIKHQKILWYYYATDTGFAAPKMKWTIPSFLNNNFPDKSPTFSSFKVSRQVVTTYSPFKKLSPCLACTSHTKTLCQPEAHPVATECTAMDNTELCTYESDCSETKQVLQTITTSNDKPNNKQYWRLQKLQRDNNRHAANNNEKWKKKQY